MHNFIRNVCVLSTEGCWAKSKRCHFFPYPGILVSACLLDGWRNRLWTVVESSVDGYGGNEHGWYQLGFVSSFLRCFSFAELPWYQRKVAAVLFASPPTSTFEEVKCWATSTFYHHCNIKTKSVCLKRTTFYKLELKWTSQIDCSLSFDKIMLGFEPLQCSGHCPIGMWTSAPVSSLL